MGELRHTVGRRGALPALVPLVALVVALSGGCGLVAPTGPATSAPSQSGAPATAGSGVPSGAPVSASPATGSIDPAVGRLVWLVDRTGAFGVWTTDLAGGDARTYLAGLDEEGTTIRDARLVGEDVALIRESLAASTAELWLVSLSGPPRVLLTGVTSFVVGGDAEVLAVRDVGATRSIWRVPLDTAAPTSIAEFPVPDHGPQVGPFGFAISPDGRTVAAGWVGGPLVVSGPVPGTFRDLGAPLVVGDDGRVVAGTGRAGEAYLVDGEQLVELAPPDSDPLAVPGTGRVAWATVGENGGLRSVEVRDLLAGTTETYPADGPATNVQQLTPTHVILEATAFDPLKRTVGVVDRRDGRSATFEASAPAGE